MTFLQRKNKHLFFALMLLCANAFGGDCIPYLKKRCHKPLTCTDDVFKESRHIVFMDVNFSHCEVEKIRCDAKKNCEQFTVLPRIDSSKIQEFKKRIRRKDNYAFKKMAKYKACRSSKPEYLRLCIRKVIENVHVTKNKDKRLVSTLFKGLLNDEDIVFKKNEDYDSEMEFVESDDILDAPLDGVHEIDYLKRLKRLSSRFKPGLNNSIILSGHSDGHSIWGGNFSYPEVDFQLIPKHLNRENIESIFFAACSTGGESALKNELRMCGPIPPGRIYGINGTSPGNSTFSAKALADLLKIDNEIRESRDLGKALSFIKNSYVNKHFPTLLMGNKESGEACSLHTVSPIGGIRDFDPRESCGSYSRSLLSCINALTVFGSDVHFKDACQFDNDEVGKRSYEKYLKPLEKYFERFTPLENYFGFSETSSVYEDEWKFFDKKGIAHKIFKGVYRVLQEDASCLEEVEGHLASNIFSLYRLGSAEQVENIRKNVLERFNEFLGVNGQYNQMMAKVNALGCSPEEMDLQYPLIENDQFSSRKKVMKFLQIIQDLELALDFSYESKKCGFSTELYENTIEVSKKLRSLLDHYILRADTEIHDCNSSNKFIYETTYDFKNPKERAEYFRSGAKEELNCLKRLY